MGCRSAIRAKGGPRALLGVLLKAPGDDAPICAVVSGLLAELTDSQQPDLAAQVRAQGMAGRPHGWQRSFAQLLWVSGLRLLRGKRLRDGPGQLRWMHRCYW